MPPRSFIDISRNLSRCVSFGGLLFRLLFGRSVHALPWLAESDVLGRSTDGLGWA